MKYKITLGKESVSFRATAYNEFKDQVALCFASDAGYIFTIDGAEVTKEQALEHCADVKQAAWDKKNITHKRIVVSTGCTTLSNTKQEIWVKR